MPDDPQRHSELASFGEELRREREIRGISLKEIADSTKISKRFLEAIERNDHKTLPAPVFTRGFIREYARYLGLNAEEIVNRYNFAAVGDERIEQSDHLERLTQPQTPPLPRDRQREKAEKMAEKKAIPPFYARIDRSIIATVLIVAALIGATWWAVKYKRQRGAEESHVESTTVVTAAAPVPKPVVPAPAPPPPAPEASKLRLDIQVVANSWVTLEADGKTVINDELRRGDHRVFEANEAFRFRTIGNAAGLALTLNDKRIPPLGDDGEVLRDRVFDRSTLQEPAPEGRSST